MVMVFGSHPKKMKYRVEKALAFGDLRAVSLEGPLGCMVEAKTLW